MSFFEAFKWMLQGEEAKNEREKLNSVKITNAFFPLLLFFIFGFIKMYNIYESNINTGRPFGRIIFATTHIGRIISFIFLKEHNGNITT